MANGFTISGAILTGKTWSGLFLKPRDTENSIQSDEIARICKSIGFEVEREGDIVKLIGYRPMS